jgi:hypothetical protein
MFRMGRYEDGWGYRRTILRPRREERRPVTITEDETIELNPAVRDSVIESGDSVMIVSMKQKVHKPKEVEALCNAPVDPRD